MTESSQHPITPPPELVDNWLAHAPNPLDRLQHIATQAARWGADQELEACCIWMKIHLHSGSNLSKQLHAARRPKPSLAERAVHILSSHGDLSCEEHALISRILQEHIHV